MLSIRETCVVTALLLGLLLTAERLHALATVRDTTAAVVMAVAVAIYVSTGKLVVEWSTFGGGN
jgi:hypothetical protein